ncbi:MAG: hypothetical protein Q3986_06445 [Akkermansia sp.]|nr:hypothetical protein [Akkermansia sp.]
MKCPIQKELAAALLRLSAFIHPGSVTINNGTVAINTVIDAEGILCLQGEDPEGSFVEVGYGPACNVFYCGKGNCISVCSPTGKETEISCNPFLLAAVLYRLKALA